MAQVCLNLLAYGRVSQHVQRADVRGPGGLNTIPAMVLGEIACDSPPEVFRFADVERPEVTREVPSAENVNAGDGPID